MKLPAVVAKLPQYLRQHWILTGNCVPRGVLDPTALMGCEHDAQDGKRVARQLGGAKLSRRSALGSFEAPFLVEAQLMFPKYFL